MAPAAEALMLASDVLSTINATKCVMHLASMALSFPARVTLLT